MFWRSRGCGFRLCHGDLQIRDEFSQLSQQFVHVILDHYTRGMDECEVLYAGLPSQIPRNDAASDLSSYEHRALKVIVQSL